MEGDERIAASREASRTSVIGGHFYLVGPAGSALRPPDTRSQEGKGERTSHDALSPKLSRMGCAGGKTTA
jgi:hypothetical protein